MANVAIEALLQATAQGATDLRGVMSPNKSLPFLIAARGDIESAADLVGKRFGIGRIGSVDHLLSMKVLESAGVDTSKLELVALGQPQARAQALLADQIDATTMSIGTYTAIDDDPAVARPDRRRRLLPGGADPLQGQRRARPRCSPSAATRSRR